MDANGKFYKKIMPGDPEWAQYHAPAQAVPAVFPLHEYERAVGNVQWHASNFKAQYPELAGAVGGMKGLIGQAMREFVGGYDATFFRAAPAAVISSAGRADKYLAEALADPELLADVTGGGRARGLLVQLQASVKVLHRVAQSTATAMMKAPKIEQIEQLTNPPPSPKDYDYSKHQQYHQEYQSAVAKKSSSTAKAQAFAALNAMSANQIAGCVVEFATKTGLLTKKAGESSQEFAGRLEQTWGKAKLESMAHQVVLDAHAGKVASYDLSKHKVSLPDVAFRHDTAMTDLVLLAKQADAMSGQQILDFAFDFAVALGVTTKKPGDPVEVLAGPLMVKYGAGGLVDLALAMAKMPRAKAIAPAPAQTTKSFGPETLFGVPTWMVAVGALGVILGAIALGRASAK